MFNLELSLRRLRATEWNGVSAPWTAPEIKDAFPCGCATAACRRDAHGCVARRQGCGAAPGNQLGTHRAEFTERKFFYLPPGWQNRKIRFLKIHCSRFCSLSKRRWFLGAMFAKIEA